jgi:hypothetical protein
MKSGAHILKYGTIEQLGYLFGRRKSSKEVNNALIVALDTESARGRVTEIGVSILNTKDIKDISTNTDIAACFQKVKHHHFVIDTGSQGEQMRRMDTSIFAESRKVSSKAMKASLLEILETELHGSGQSTFYLAGHTITNDVSAVRRDSTAPFDVLDFSPSNIQVQAILDTYFLADEVEYYRGRRFAGKSLGHLLRQLGAPRQYWSPDGRSVIGWHNASNDAAYTMMALLLFVLKPERAIQQLLEGTGGVTIRVMKWIWTMKNWLMRISFG